MVTSVNLPATSNWSWITKFGPFLGLVIVILTFAILTGSPERYLAPFNLRIVLSQTVVVAISAIGMTIIIVSGGIDLSVGAVIALAGVVTALALAAGMPPIVAVAAALGIGALVGIVNGALITRLKVVPFIVTLGMLGMARGVAKWLANETTVNVPSTWVNNLLLTFPTPAWLVLAPGV
jgi:ribose transport system permease protein